MNRDIAKRLRELGCQEIGGGKGSHRKWHNPANDKVTVVPDWGAKDLALGTVRAVIRELGISREDFESISRGRSVTCPYSIPKTDSTKFFCPRRNS
jgi:predicted RNA binding protein YcfA (HicA-like mRNA interferase family)